MILQGGGRVFLWVDCPVILHYFLSLSDISVEL